MPSPSPVAEPARRYYEQVAAYYDGDAATFGARAAQNLVLQRIRQDFRDRTEPYCRGHVLEIGCGTGLDLAYWAGRRPDAVLHGIDVSPAMLDASRQTLRSAGIDRVATAVGTIESVPALFPGTQFDLVYCYFGALNTTADLGQAAESLRRLLRPGGIAVLTFVNRWYLLEMAYYLVRLRWRQAFARCRHVWGGYSPAKTLESRCPGPGEIRRAFGPHFLQVARRGYSILYPAWYRNSKWVRRYGRLANLLWTLDTVLNRTPAWATGEYALYTLQARPPRP